MPPAVKERNGADTLEISGILIPSQRRRKTEEKESVRGGQWGDDAWPFYQRRTWEEVSKKEDNLIYLCQIFFPYSKEGKV